MGEEKTINFKTLKIGKIKLNIVGKTPYMPEPMDWDMIERYNKKKSNQSFDKDTKSEEDKAKLKYYYTEDGKKGIPTRQFYKSMINASRYLFDRKDGGMRNIKEGITILGDIIPLKYTSEKKLTHWGGSGGIARTPMKIIRNAFYDWSCDLEIEYNKEHISPEQIINVLNWAGFHVGVGSFRKEKTGNYGMFYVNI